MRTRQISIALRAHTDRTWSVAIVETTWPPLPYGTSRLVLQRWASDRELVAAVAEVAQLAIQAERQTQVRGSEDQREPGEALQLPLG